MIIDHLSLKQKPEGANLLGFPVDILIYKHLISLQET